MFGTGNGGKMPLFGVHSFGHLGAFQSAAVYLDHRIRSHITLPGPPKIADRRNAGGSSRVHLPCKTDVVLGALSFHAMRRSGNPYVGNSNRVRRFSLANRPHPDTHYPPHAGSNCVIGVQG